MWNNPQDCVLGYVRRVEKLLPTDDDIYFVIPPLIVQWIILYYYIQEEFDVDHYEKIKYELSQNNTVIKQKPIFAPGSVYRKNSKIRYTSMEIQNDRL